MSLPGSSGVAPPASRVRRAELRCTALSFSLSTPTRPPALQAATSAPLIERSIERATGIVYNITGGKDLTLQVGAGCMCAFGLLRWNVGGTTAAH